MVALVVKNLAANAGKHKRSRFYPWVGKITGGGYVNPIQYSFLEKSMDRRASQATVHRVAKSWMQLK